MAFVDPTQDPESQNQNPSQVDQALNPSAAAQAQQQQQDAQSAPPTTSAGGGSGVVSGATGNAGGSAPTAATPKPSSSGSWTNIDSYLNANADQGAKVGTDIAGTINNQGAQAQNDIQNLGVNFKSAVDQNTVNQDPNAVSGAINAATSATANQGLTQDQIAAFNAQANASYSGPTDATSFNGYNQTQQDLNTAQQSAGETQSESGRDVLLNNQYQNASVNGYNQGENNLDQLLLQDSAGGQAALKPLAGQWGGLTSALNNTVTSGNSAAQAAQATDAATAAAARGAVGNQENTFQTNIGNELASENADRTALISRINSGKLTDADLAALGVGNSNWGVGLSNFATGTAPLTNANVTTQDQLAQYNALQQLTGTYDPSAASKSMYAGAQPTDFGNKPAPIDVSGYSKAISDAQQAATHADLLSALQPIAGQGGDLATIVNPIIQGVNNGTINPDQAHQMLQQQIAAAQHAYGANSGQANFLINAISPFTNYYNRYQQLAGSTLVNNMVGSPSSSGMNQK